MTLRPALLAAAGATAVAAAAPAALAQAGPTWQAKVDLGLVHTTGNSRLTSLSLGERVSFRRAPWVLSQRLSAVNGRADGVETVSSIKMGLRSDYDLGSLLSAYGYASFERDRFAGVARRLEQGAGLTWNAVRAPRDTLLIEGGLGANQQRSTAMLTSSYGSARAAMRYRHTLAATSYVWQTAELLQNLREGDDLRINSVTELVAPLSSRIGLKVTYAVRVDTRPEPGFRRTDTIFSSGLQVTF